MNDQDLSEATNCCGFVRQVKERKAQITEIAQRIEKSRVIALLTR